MKRYLYTILCGAAMACTALLTGCVKEPLEDNGTPGDGKTITATFTLSSEAVEEIEVRSVAGIDERLIKDLWVIQLAPDGLSQLQDPQYITTLTQGQSDYKVSVSLKRSASKVYFIANTHDANTYKDKTTTADVEAVTMAVANEASIASTNGIPMSGVWTGTPDLLGIAGQVSLSRAIAKVNFKLDATLPKGESFLLTSVQVKQVPNKLHGYRDASTTGAFPVSPTVTSYDPTSYAKVNLTAANPQSLWWYLPENTRGTGTATIQGDKAKLFPADQKDYCTYIEIVGDYILGTGQGFTSTYKIYLGANNTTDYNLNRNTTYNVNTTIKGIDASDTRIDNVVIQPLDYTDNGTAWFLIAPYDTNNPADGSNTMNWYIANGVYDATYNPNTLSACPAGWRVPTFLESGLIWIYKKATPDIATINSPFHWTSNDYNTTNAYLRYLNLGAGYALFPQCNKSNSYSIRCVKDAPLGKKYPYVGLNDAGEARIIVSRDADGGVGSGAIHVNWTLQTPNHIDLDDTNSVPNMLEIAKSNCNTTNAPGPLLVNGGYTWEGAIQACAAYSEAGMTAGSWRLPTQRELMLIWTMHTKGELNAVLINPGNYRAATNTGYETSSLVNFADGVVDNNYKTNGGYAVRCVRDVTKAKRPPILVGQFGDWDDMKKEYTKQLQVDWGSAATDPALKWANADGATNATNKEYGVTNINTLKGLSSDLSAYPAAKYCADKGDGWYLPSQNQLMAIWIAHNGIHTNFSFSSNNYWSATDNTDTYSWNVSFNLGATPSNLKAATNNRIRCVRDLTGSGASTAQTVVVIDNKVIIDNRSMPTGAITDQAKARDTKAKNTATTTDNTVKDIASAESNKTVSRYFEVAKSDLTVSDKTWLGSLQGCRDYDSGDGNKTWRLPTQRELQLIWVLHKTIKDKGITAFGSYDYWSATEDTSTYSWYVNFNSGHTTSNTKTSSNNKVRCIRDLTPPTN